MTSLYERMMQGSAVLLWLAHGHLALLVAAALAMTLDGRQLLGVSVWLKPAKFAMSVSLFLYTVAWMMSYVERPARGLAMVEMGIALAILGEVGLIFLQGARGVPSHYNQSTPFDTAVFALMGLLILTNTVCLGFLLRLFFVNPRPLPAEFLWGIRWGLFIAILASAQGFLMAARLSHTVGAPDGGPGIPLLNWSVRAGDLRTAHFMGFHALQVMPVVGWICSQISMTGGTLVGGLIYLAGFLLLILQALAGKPLFY